MPTEQQKLRIINTHNQLGAASQAGLPDICIQPHYWQGSRERYRGGWHVWRFGKNLNPKQTSPWAGDANVKVFGATAHKDQRAALLEEAKDWVAERYGITNWKRNRMGDYVAAIVNAKFPLEPQK